MGHLPLAGGTLTGTLNGVAANFSNTVRIQGWLTGASNTNTLFSHSFLGTIIQTPSNTDNAAGSFFIKDSAGVTHFTLNTNTDVSTFAGTIESGAITVSAGNVAINNAVTGDASQFTIVNGTGATLRMGITGSGTNEAAHIKTNAGEALEFHIGQASNATTPDIEFLADGAGIDFQGVNILNSSRNMTTNSRFTFDYNDHYLEAGTNSLALKNSGGTSYFIASNTGLSVTGSITSGNITTTGYLRGPSTFTIDPAAHGDDTGTVVIAGNLQVDGTTTTINSTTLTVDDKNITLASGSANAAAADGAGFTVDIGSGTLPSITYVSATDDWKFNKPTRVSGLTNAGIAFSSTETLVDGSSALPNGRIFYHSSHLIYDSPSSGHRFAVAGNQGTNIAMVIDSGQRVGIGTTAPAAPLHVKHASGEAKVIIQAGSNTSSAVLQFGDSVDTSRGGIEYTSTDDMAFSTNNMTEAMRIRYTGNVGIGTASPAQKLQVSGALVSTDQLTSPGSAGSYTYNATALDYSSNGARLWSWGSSTARGTFNFIQLENDGTNQQTAMSIDSSGKVGIGTTAPSSILHVAGGSATIPTLSSSYPLTISNNGNSGLNIISSGTTNAGQINFGDSGDADAGRIRYDHNDNSMRFTTNATEYMRITSAGRVSVGTSTPARTFHVVSSDYSVARLERTGSGGGVSLEFRNGDGNIWGVSNDGDEVLRFYYAGVNRLQVTSGGAVRFNSAFTFPTADGSANQLLKTDGSGNMSWATVAGVGDADIISDADGDTKIQVEESADEDIIRFDAGGEEVARMQHRNNECFFDLVRRGVPAATANLSFSGTGLNTNVTSGYHSLVVQNNGSEQFRVDSNGNVGIGDSSPDYKLDIIAATDDGINIQGTRGFLRWNSGDMEIRNEGSYAMGFRTYDGSSALVERMRITSAGNVGIGTTSPDAKLRIDQDATATGLKVTGGSGGTNIAQFIRDVGANASVNINASGGDPQIQFVSAGNTFALGVNSNTFEIADNSSLGANTRFSITNAGNVGIGTTAPYYKLDTRFSDTTTALSGGNSGNWGSNGIRIDNTNTTVGAMALAHFRVGDADWHIGNKRVGTDQADFIFANEGATKMLIDHTGKVGIGTINPTSTLEIHSSAGAIPDTTNSSLQLRDTSAVAANNGGSIVFSGIYTGTSGHIGSGPYIKAYKLNATDGDYSYGLKFATRENGVGSQVIGLTITPDQNVGIGTTAPQSLLHIHSGDGGTYTPNVNHDDLTIEGSGNIGLQLFSPNSNYQYIAFGDPDSANAGYIRYHHGSNSMVFRTANSDRVTVDSSGDVGIGTTAPVDRLHISGGNILLNNALEIRTKDTGGNIRTVLRANSSNELEYGWSANAPVKFMGGGSYTERMRIHTNGNVGIGTTSPGAPLALIKPSLTTTGTGEGGLRVHRPNSASQYGYFDYGYNGGGVNIGSLYTGGGAASFGTFTFRQHSSTTSQVPMLIDNVGTVLVNGAHNNGGNANFAVDGGAYLTFYDNQVQIGNSSQNWNLKISHDMSATANMQAWNSNIVIGSNGSNTGSATARDIIFSPQTSGTAASTERMRIKGTGNVGIGTTSPTHKLHVAGDIRINNGSALKLYNAAGNGWAQISYNNTLNLIEIQRDFQSGTDSTNSLGSSAKKWLSVYSDTIKAGNGTSAAPSYTFDSDQNTGMYIDSTGDTLRFSTGGAQRMFLNSAGITSASNVYTGSGGEFRNYAGTWKATTGTAAGDFEFRGNTGGTNTGLMYMDTSTGRVAVGNGFNSTNVKAALQVEVLGIETNQSSVASTSQYTCESFPAADFRSARYTVQVTNVTDSTYHVTEILLIHDGTTPAITEFATIFTGSAAEATFDADINSGNVRLLATPASTDSMQFKVVRHSILV